MSILPDKQKVYMDALDNVFDNFLENNGLSYEEAQDLAACYCSIDRNALSFTAEEFQETYEPETDSFTAFDAMERDMQDRIRAKEKFLLEVAEDYGDVGDGCAYNIQHIIESRSK